MGWGAYVSLTRVVTWIACGPLCDQVSKGTGGTTYGGMWRVGITVTRLAALSMVVPSFFFLSSQVRSSLCPLVSLTTWSWKRVDRCLVFRPGSSNDGLLTLYVSILFNDVPEADDV